MSKGKHAQHIALIFLDIYPGLVILICSYPHVFYITLAIYYDYTNELSKDLYKNLVKVNYMEGFCSLSLFNEEIMINK